MRITGQMGTLYTHNLLVHRFGITAEQLDGFSKYVRNLLMIRTELMGKAPRMGKPNLILMSVESLRSH